MFTKCLHSSTCRPRWRLCLIFISFLTGFLSLWAFWEYQSRGKTLVRWLDPDYFESDGQIGGTKKYNEFANKTEFENEIEKEWNGNIDNVQKKIVLGAVSCRDKNEDIDRSKYSLETLVMLKSVLISAQVYNISKVELHLFLEWLEDEVYFVRKLEEMGYPTEDNRLVVFTYSAVDMVPEKHREHMVYHPRYRCGYTRFFFPSSLPHVDSIIHLDSDMIITGNLWKIWSLFSEFQDEQIIGLARSNELHDIYHLRMYQRWFGDIPHPPPRGINAGLLLMNLTRMREYSWEEKFIETYEDYSQRVVLTGQRTVSILLAKDLKILKMLSCKYNFCHRHCDEGFTCLDALPNQDGGLDEGGIHLVHGNGRMFEKTGVFHKIFRVYHLFNMNLVKDSAKGYDGLLATLKSHLWQPIRTFYDQDHVYSCSKCFGTLNQVIFQEFFTSNSTLALDIVN